MPGLTNVMLLVPFRDSISWQLVFNISAIFYGIALVKNTAPEHLQPQSTSAVGLIFTRAPTPFYLIMKLSINHVIWIGFVC
jgi:hypothetical protein